MRNGALTSAKSNGMAHDAAAKRRARQAGPLESRGAARAQTRLRYSCVRVSISILSPVCDEQRHRDLEAGGDLGGLQHLARGVALDGRLGVGDLAHDAGRQLDRDGLAVVEHHFDRHAVFEVVDRVAHVLGLDLELVVLGVHEDVHRVGEVGVGALLLVEDDLVHLVVGLEDDFGAGVVEQALQLHAHGGGVAAAAAVFGLQHDHRVLAVHDDVAGADFLSDFHGVIPLECGAQELATARAGARGRKALEF